MILTSVNKKQKYKGGKRSEEVYRVLIDVRPDAEQREIRRGEKDDRNEH